MMRDIEVTYWTTTNDVLSFPELEEGRTFPFMIAAGLSLSNINDGKDPHNE
ncbi:MAG: hypothetical protein WDO15_04210 [Bacteroidota bacterium]